MKKTVCLNMIVKDESAVIERCLNTIKPLLDSWCIVDTGSTDDTKEKIQSLLGDLPGELHERPWSDFGTNRTEALELAKPHADFLLLSDASFIWKVDDDFELPDFSHDAYFAKIRMRGTSWRLPILINTQKSWFFKAKSHSALNCYDLHVRANIDGIEIESRADSSRRKSSNPRRKYENDVKVFLELLDKNPDDTRSTFYLAQSYRDCGDPKSALLWYDKCSRMNGWREERWYAHYQVGVMHERIGSPVSIIERAYLDAYQFDPLRAEPLVALCARFRKEKNYAKTHLYACAAREIPYPADVILFVDDGVYEWRTLDEYAISAYWIGKYSEAQKANEALLESAKLPEKQRQRVRNNLEFCQRKTAV